LCRESDNSTLQTIFRQSLNKMNSIVITTYRFLKFFICIYCLLMAHFSVAQQETDPNGFNVFYYPNGNKSSEGYFENGKPNGYWKTYHENGKLKSEGNRKNFQLDSLWRFYNEEGMLDSEIEYANNRKNGLSKTYNKEGLLVRIDQVLNDTLVRISKLYYPEEQRINYELPYEKGKLNGTGYEFAKDSRIIAVITYEAGVEKTREQINRLDPKGQKQGRWLTFYEDEPGHIVQSEGRYKNDLKNGYFREYDRKGVLLSTTKYVNGQVMENAEELMAVDIERDFHPNAQVHWEKSYLGGTPHGVWKEYNDTGAVINSKIYRMGILLGEGVIDSEGVKQGFWKEFYSTGELRAEGEYLNGARYKDWKFYHINGELEQKGSYREGGLEQGTWKWYYDNKQLRRVEQYRKGKEDGDVVEYDRNGKEILVGSYYEGLEDGDWMVEMGEYKEEGKYTEGLKQGEWKHYYLTNDEVSFEGTYTEGYPDGKHTYFFDNGKKMLEGKYQMGMKQGDWKRYDRDGILVFTIRYRDGETIKLDGRKVKTGK